ncbi:MAG: cyclodeaminase/cyclohydrolase family protein [Armatimonadetes bacterium]|nr:cyclodeaminase/cyclohydrolase family protein [Armatimonadota bacterium]
MHARSTLEEFLTALAEAAPEPAGGAAAALAGAASAALVGMVADLAAAREPGAPATEEMARARGRLDVIRGELLALVDRDVEAVRGLHEAFRRARGPGEDEAAHRAARQEAIRHATQVPAEIARLCREVVALSVIVAAADRGGTLADVGTGALLAGAAAGGAALIVCTNSAAVADRAVADALCAEMDALRVEAARLAARVAEQVRARLAARPSS